mmetsp:Transcript_63213/g.159435  ORF Transcript_63213/g.159435 Transcript_63213/m.159435 type:complete len:222 (-) Transcript_63213:684-1349(-)
MLLSKVVTRPVNAKLRALITSVFSAAVLACSPARSDHRVAKSSSWLSTSCGIVGCTTGTTGTGAGAGVGAGAGAGAGGGGGGSAATGSGAFSGSSSQRTDRSLVLLLAKIEAMELLRVLLPVNNFSTNSSGDCFKAESLHPGRWSAASPGWPPVKSIMRLKFISAWNSQSGKSLSSSPNGISSSPALKFNEKTPNMGTKVRSGAHTLLETIAVTMKGVKKT